MNQRTIGHDSEFGLINNGQLISALDAFGEDVFEDKHGRYFADNLNCEIAINPVTTLSQFHDYTEGLLSRVRERGYDFLMEPIIHYPDTCLSNPLSKISGCNPDFSAYTQEIFDAPNFEVLDGTRSCGAHIHAALDGGDPCWYSRWMDLLVTLPLLRHEQPSSRRDMYGKAGCMRTKEYGAEYRTLSNVWLDDASKREFVWEMTHKAADLSKTTDPSIIDDWWDIPTAIDTHDLVLAQKCIDRLYVYGVMTL